MHPVANHLIQLQELSLIREEQKLTKVPGRLQQLDAAIRGMAAELPPLIKARFDKLRNRDHVVIVPVANGICAGCGMQLPISLVQAVRLERDIQSCPNCARMLYFPTSAARRVSATPRRTAPRKVGIARFSSQALMVPQLEASDREGVIRELAQKMEVEGFVENAGGLIEAALRREAIVSTAFDHGLAFPHARGVEGGGLTLALGLSRKGLHFGGEDAPLSHIVFFMVIPTAASAFYLKLLAGLTETFMKTDARKAILAEKEPQGLWKALTKVTRAAIK